ncbi:MAG: gas vesicle protein GvpN [Leptolyngbyaceae cyanobacterium CSU_1_3]|nr:gas vesicle protein GvpN [Leptolyngbyaceae cyanobacterium CSU_1_3]
MTTVLRASPRRFVSTPAIERITTRALRYLQSGFSIHLRGPAGTGKTTLALHLADLLTRPIMLIYGDDEAKSSDLIGTQSGYTRKRLVDNFIHSVVKVEDELRQNWVDSRLTLACRDGFTLVYDEFNRSRPEVNNVLLSALEEKLLVLPPSSNQAEYVRVNPDFRAILTSNPEEYCGVHSTQDALMDRLVTLTMPEPDELTQQEILVQKTEIDRASALLIVRLVKSFRSKTKGEKISGLRSCLVIAKVCQEHEIPISPTHADFREICSDVLLSRIGIAIDDATKILWRSLNDMLHPDLLQVPVETLASDAIPFAEAVAPQETVDETPELTIKEQLVELFRELNESESSQAAPPEAAIPEVNDTAEASLQEAEAHEQEIYRYLQKAGAVRLTKIESDLRLTRLHILDAIRSLIKKGQVAHRDRLFSAQAAPVEVDS